MFDDGCFAFKDGNGTSEAGFIRAIQHSNSSNIDTVIYKGCFIITEDKFVNGIFHTFS